MDPLKLFAIVSIHIGFIGLIAGVYAALFHHARPIFNRRSIGDWIERSFHVAVLGFWVLSYFGIIMHTLQGTLLP
jgi:hypothetical protein